MNADNAGRKGKRIGIKNFPIEIGGRNWESDFEEDVRKFQNGGDKFIVSCRRIFAQSMSTLANLPPVARVKAQIQ